MGGRLNLGYRDKFNYKNLLLLSSRVKSILFDFYLTIKAISLEYILDFIYLYYIFAITVAYDKI
jgi:hypothetical protein